MYDQDNFWDKILESFHPELCAGGQQYKTEWKSKVWTCSVFQNKYNFFSK